MKSTHYHIDSELLYKACRIWYMQSKLNHKNILEPSKEETTVSNSGLYTPETRQITSKPKIQKLTR